MGFLQGLRNHIAGRHFDELTLVPSKGTFDQHADCDAHAFELHVLFLGWRDVEAAELCFRCAGAGAKLNPAVAQQIECGDPLGDARGMVDVGRRLHDAVADANVLGALAHGTAIPKPFEETMLEVMDRVIVPAPEGWLSAESMLPEDR